MFSVDSYKIFSASNRAHVHMKLINFFVIAETSPVWRLITAFDRHCDDNLRADFPLVSRLVAKKHFCFDGKAIWGNFYLSPNWLLSSSELMPFPINSAEGHKLNRASLYRLQKWISSNLTSTNWRRTHVCVNTFLRNSSQANCVAHFVWLAFMISIESD